MGVQSARMMYKGTDHKDIYFQGMYHTQMYVGNSLVWEKLIKHPNYAQYYMITPTICAYGNHIVDEFGEYIIANEEAIIRKSAAYIVWEYDGEFGMEIPNFTIACVGENITSIRFEGYFSYKGEIIYTHANASTINVFYMNKSSSGIWNYSNFSLIRYNFKDVNGKNMVIHSIGVSGDNMRIFDNLSEMQSWLLS